MEVKFEMWIILVIAVFSTILSHGIYSYYVAIIFVICCFVTLLQYALRICPTSGEKSDPSKYVGEGDLLYGLMTILLLVINHNIVGDYSVLGDYLIFALIISFTSELCLIYQVVSRFHLVVLTVVWSAIITFLTSVITVNIWLAFGFTISKIVAIYFLSCIFGASFSHGEKSILTQSLGVLLYDFCCKAQYYNAIESTNGITLMVELLIISTVIVLIFLFPLFYVKTHSKEDFRVAILLDILFYMLSFALVKFIYFDHFYKYFNVSIFVWLFRFITSRSIYLMIIIYWLSIIIMCFGMIWFYLNRTMYQTKVPKTVVRKFFHLIVVLIFIPSIYDPRFMAIISSYVFVVFIIVETIRCTKIEPFWNLVQVTFQSFTDEQDRGILIITNIYLLVGLSFPFWLESESSDTLDVIPLLSGVISIGVGDSFASIVGTYYATKKWPNSEKTYGGTIACLLSQISTILFILYAWRTEMSVSLLSLYLLSCLLISLLEAFSSQIDNLVLPIYSYILFKSVSVFTSIRSL